MGVKKLNYNYGIQQGNKDLELLHKPIITERVE